MIDEIGHLKAFCVHIHNTKLDEDIYYEKTTHTTHGVVGEDLAALCIESAMQCIFEEMDFIDIKDKDQESIHNLVARNMLNHSLSVAVDVTLGEGAVYRINKCVTCAMDKICIWYISKALEWRKVFMLIFTNPRGSWFLARLWHIVCWCGYGYAHTLRIVCWCGYGYGIW